MIARIRLVTAVGLLTLFVTALAANPPAYQLMRVASSGAAWVEPVEQPQAPPAKDDTADRLRRLEDKLDRLIKLMEEAIGPEESPTPIKDEKGGQSLNAGLAKCAGCHNDRDAPKKADKVVLFKVQQDGGKLFRDDFSARELRTIVREVKEGTMPKKSSGLKLTDAEKTAILAEANARLSEPPGK